RLIGFLPFPPSACVCTVSTNRLPVGATRMAASPKRSTTILAAWNDRGKIRWNPEIHGKGEPLLIKVSESMGPASAAHAPRPTPDMLEFRIEARMVDGKPVPSVVCEGVVVATLPLEKPRPDSRQPA